MGWNKTTALGQEYSHNRGDGTDTENASGVDNATTGAKTTGSGGFGARVGQARKLRVGRAYEGREGRDGAGQRRG